MDDPLETPEKQKSTCMTIVGFVIVGLIVVFLVAEAELVQTAQESTTALLLATMSCSFNNLAYLTSFVSYYSSRRSKSKVSDSDRGYETTGDGFTWTTDTEEDPFGETSPLETSNPTFLEYLIQAVTKDGLTKRSLALKSLSLGLLFWTVLAIYFYALGKTEAASAVTIYNTCTAFVYAFSLCLLKEKLELIKLIAVALSIVGVILVSFGDIGSTAGDESESEKIVVNRLSGDSSDDQLSSETIDAIVGDVAAFVAAIGTGLYFVLFKKLIGDASNVTISLYTGLTGTVVLILLGPITVIQLIYIQWQLPDAGMVLVIVCATCAGFLINYLMNVGISLTSPLFISIGCMLSVPGTAVADLVFRKTAIEPLQLLGILVVITGFILLNIDVQATKLRLVQCYRKIKHSRASQTIQSPEQSSDNELL